jgi:hypothetical protein
LIVVKRIVGSSTGAGAKDDVDVEADLYTDEDADVDADNAIDAMIDAGVIGQVGADSRRRGGEQGLRGEKIRRVLKPGSWMLKTDLGGRSSPKVWKFVGDPFLETGADNKGVTFKVNDPIPGCWKGDHPIF